MARHTVHVAPGVGIVHGTLNADTWNKHGGYTLLIDRVANGEAFPGEHVIRLPRRFTQLSPQNWRRLLEADRERREVRS